MKTFLNLSLNCIKYMTEFMFVEIQEKIPKSFNWDKALMIAIVSLLFLYNY